MGEEATSPGEDGRQWRDNIQCPTGVEETEKKKKKEKKKKGENQQIKDFVSMYTVDLISSFKKWLFSFAFNKPTSVTTGLRSDYKLNV